MTSLNVAVGPVGNCARVSSEGIKDGATANNLTDIVSVCIGQDPTPRYASLVSSVGCCSDVPIQHTGVRSFRVLDEVPGETTTE